MKGIFRKSYMRRAVKCWLKRYSVLLIGCLCLGLGLYCWSTRPCALCGSQPYHGLCLVDLEKGTVSELTVYDADPQQFGTASGSDSSGTLSLLQLGTLIGYRDTATHSAGVNIPVGLRRLSRLRFCDACCGLLEKDFSVGYMVADLLDPSSPAVYPLISGASYQVRDYVLSIATAQEGLRIKVTGTLD